jgi:hypothetical protein
MASSRVGTSTSAARRRRRAAGGQPLQQGQRERRGLAGAGGGLAEQVAALEQRRDGLALDRGGLLVAEPRLAVAGQRRVRLAAHPVDVPLPGEARSIDGHLADDHDRPAWALLREVADGVEIDPVLHQPEEAHDGAREGSHLGRDVHRVGERGGEVGVIDAVRGEVGLGVPGPLPLDQRARGREDHVGAPAELLLHAGDAAAVDVGELRPLVGDVVDDQRLAQGADIAHRGGQEGPELEVAHAEATAQAPHRRLEDAPVERRRRARVGQGKDDGREHREARLDALGAGEKGAQLADDLPAVAAARQARRAGRDRVQPQDLVVPGQPAHDVVVARRVLGPVLGEADDAGAGEAGHAHAPPSNAAAM